MFNAKAKTFPIDNTEMQYVVFGKGEKPLLIVPGLGDGVQNVSKSARALAFFYRKYAKDYRVYVCSRKDQLPESYTTHDMANDIAQFMKAHRITPSYVMGVSMGGMIVQHLTANYPEYVEKLIIAVSSSKPNQISNSVIGGWINMVKEGRYGDFTIDTMEKTYSKQYLWKYRPFYFILRRSGKPVSNKHFLAQANACLNHDAHKQLKSIKCPTLVVGGEQDHVLGGQASKLIAQQISGSRLIMYSEWGHGAFQESNQFNNDSIDFFDNKNNI